LLSAPVIPSRRRISPCLTQSSHTFPLQWPTQHVTRHYRNVREMFLTGQDIRECPVTCRQTGDESTCSKGRHPTMNHGRNRLFKLGVREKAVRVKAEERLSCLFDRT